MDTRKQFDLIQQVTANYFLWQGLRLIPVGAFLFFQAVMLAEPAWWPFSAVPELLVILIACIPVYIAFHAIGAYYERTFGHVHSKPGLHQRRDTVKWIVVYPAMGASLLLDASMRPPVFVTGLVWGCAVVAYWWTTGRARIHYLPVAVLFAATAFLPTLGLIEAGKPIIAFFLAIVGLAYMVAGILDHRELIKILHPVREDSHETDL
jgi:hypothetical protein